MTSRASSSGMLLATAQGAVSAMMASRFPDSVCFEHLASSSIQPRYNLNVLSPEDALAVL